MTSKQEAILQTALRLFATKGFDAVPTSQIAKEADVSEGLIFRHFKNKLGLLNAIMQVGQERAEPIIKEILAIQSPQSRIQKVMEMPFHIDEDQYPLWRLIYSIKWQNDFYDDEMSKPIKDILVHALQELNYADASAEADLIMSYMDGFATTILLKGKVVDKNKLLNTLRKKY